MILWLYINVKIHHAMKSTLVKLRYVLRKYIRKQLIFGNFNVLWKYEYYRYEVIYVQLNCFEMYNGIGLDTARGSGTNGYVQRNLSFIRRHKDKVDYKSEEELKKLDSQTMKGPNREILDHERKRKVELKCMEMQELMEEQGCVHTVLFNVALSS